MLFTRARPIPLRPLFCSVFSINKWSIVYLYHYVVQLWRALDVPIPSSTTILYMSMSLPIVLVVHASYRFAYTIYASSKSRYCMFSSLSAQPGTWEHTNTDRFFSFLFFLFFFAFFFPFRFAHNGCEVPMILNSVKYNLRFFFLLLNAVAFSPFFLQRHWATGENRAWGRCIIYYSYIQHLVGAVVAKKRKGIIQRDVVVSHCFNFKHDSYWVNSSVTQHAARRHVLSN